MRKGSIRKRGAKYQLTIDTGVDDSTGKRRRHYSTHQTEEEAERALADIMAQIDRGTYIKETNDSVADFLDEWFRVSRRHYRENTAYVYGRYLEMLRPMLPEIKAKDMKKLHAEELINRLLQRYKPSTVRYCKRLLSTAFKRGVDWEIIGKNPFVGVKVTGGDRDYTVWNPEEAHQFMTSVKSRCKNPSYFVAFLLALSCGMRKSEILGLRWENVDIDRRLIYVKESLHQNYITGERYVSKPKSKAGNRAIWLDDMTADELRKHKEARPQLVPPKDFVCSTADYNTLHQRNLTQVLYRIIKDEGLPRLRFHDLRHTHASLLLSAGISPKVTQERLGHARIETTMNTYSHVLPSLQQEAADKIGELLKPVGSPSAFSSAERSADRSE
jgi:integrase